MAYSPSHGLTGSVGMGSMGLASMAIGGSAVGHLNYQPHPSATPPPLSSREYPSPPGSARRVTGTHSAPVGTMGIFDVAVPTQEQVNSAKLAADHFSDHSPSLDFTHDISGYTGYMAGNAARSQPLSQPGSLLYQAGPPGPEWRSQSMPLGSLGSVPKSLGPSQSMPLGSMVPKSLGPSLPGPTTMAPGALGTGVGTPRGSVHDMWGTGTPVLMTPRLAPPSQRSPKEHVMPITHHSSAERHQRSKPPLSGRDYVESMPSQRGPAPQNLDVQAIRAEHALVCHLQSQLDHRLATLERITEGAVLKEIERGPGHVTDVSDGTFKHDFLVKPLHGYYVQRNQVDRREQQLVLLDGDRHSCPPQIMWMAGMAAA